MESWVPAIIMGIVSIIVCLINNHRNANEFFLKQTAQIEDMADHNGSGGNYSYRDEYCVFWDEN